MKRLFLSFILLSLFSLFYAQENQKFTLLGNSFTSELKFQANPVGTEEITIHIFPEGIKAESPAQEITKKFTINRGKQTLKIDLSGLVDGNYSFEIVQKVYVQKLDSSVVRRVFTENFTKN